MWKNGIALSSLSSAPQPARSLISRALLMVPRCVSIAPFGAPVVPLVYWICSTSPGATAACRSASWRALTRPASDSTASKLAAPGSLPAPSSAIRLRSGSASPLRSASGSAMDSRSGIRAESAAPMSLPRCSATARSVPTLPCPRR